ncbi:cyclin-dependent kinase inhibitor 3-like isoform X1 [Olea europaea subsp. europaea]|uniref:Cyclin-dependent kinase inhibitor 3-like isoform X1 n=1 Tax=Olea europaea subsp. europaea TaxID=158383 RepID=A0A8S0TBZ3_OLEEU|nr:cyclin-dependent kinase inhibitor 3-like isoform X1 [Olea europaea subsp. europaea]
MGKYMRKDKIGGDVSVMELSQSTPGVRTRAKTLALQRLQSSFSVAAQSKPESCYLQLRSRRLEKTFFSRHQQNSPKGSEQKQGYSCGEKEGTDIALSCEKEYFGSYVKSGSIGMAKKEEKCFEMENRVFETGDLEIEASFGENNLDWEARERSTRESTPCSLIGAAGTVSTPGSTTRQMSPEAAIQRSRNAILRNIPAALEIEDFFARAEQSQQRLFMEKYNFDVANDIPLPGRYEWVRAMP